MNGASTTSTTPVWRLVLKQELTEMWLGGRALNLLIVFCLLLSITAYLLGTNSELSLTPPREMEVITLQAIMAFGLFIGLVLGADCITGERERVTLEPLLLSSASRQQIVLGKFLAALSPWPVAFLLSVPYLIVLAQGDAVMGPSLVWGAVFGTLLAIGFTCVGMLVSIWSNSSRISLFISLLIFLVSLLPGQLPGEVKTSFVGRIMQVVDPLESTNQFLQQGLIDGAQWSVVLIYLVACIVATIVILAVLFLYAAPRLGLDGGARIARPIWNRMEAVK